MIIEQIQIGGFDIFCYVLGDAETGEGIVVDPGGSADLYWESHESRDYQDNAHRQHAQSCGSHCGKPGDATCH